MKKIFILFLTFFFLQQSMACSICGCSSGNYFIGPFPKFNKYFIGTRYTFRSFHSLVAGDPTQYSKDFYQSVELWGGSYFGSKRNWQVMGFLPYSFNRQVSDDGSSYAKGLGDMTILVNYKVLDISHENGLVQQVWFGGGIKLPTGKFSVDPDDIVPSANNQPGSGSTDFIMDAVYSWHLNNWGISSVVNYKINQSASDYQFGNRLNATAFVYRSFPTSKAIYSPNVGLFYENLKPNKLDGVQVEDTGGNALLVATGLETSIKNVVIGFNTQLPINQSLSSGQTLAKIRGMVHVTFTF